RGVRSVGRRVLPDAGDSRVAAHGVGGAAAHVRTAIVAARAVGGRIVRGCRRRHRYSGGVCDRAARRERVGVRSGAAGREAYRYARAVLTTDVSPGTGW